MYVLPAGIPQEYALHFALFNFHLVLYETKGGAGLDKCLSLYKLFQLWYSSTEKIFSSHFLRLVDSSFSGYGACCITKHHGAPVCPRKIRALSDATEKHESCSTCSLTVHRHNIPTPLHFSCLHSICIISIVLFGRDVEKACDCPNQLVDEQLCASQISTRTNQKRKASWKEETCYLTLSRNARIE